MSHQAPSQALDECIRHFLSGLDMRSAMPGQTSGNRLTSLVKLERWASKALPLMACLWLPCAATWSPVWCNQGP